MKSWAGPGNKAKVRVLAWGYLTRTERMRRGICAPNDRCRWTSLPPSPSDGNGIHVHASQSRQPFQRAPSQHRHGSEDPLSPPPGCPVKGHFPSGTLCRPGGSSRSCRRLACTDWLRNPVSPCMGRINQCSVGVPQHRVLTVRPEAAINCIASSSSPSESKAHTKCSEHLWEKWLLWNAIYTLGGHTHSSHTHTSYPSPIPELACLLWQPSLPLHC